MISGRSGQRASNDFRFVSSMPREAIKRRSCLTWSCFDIPQHSYTCGAGVAPSMLTTSPKPEQLDLLNELRDAIANNARQKGFRDKFAEGLTPEQWAGKPGQLIRASVFTANQHGESSEFWEAFRDGRLNEPCDKAEKMKAAGLPPLTCAEEEIADEIIRALDKAEAFGVDVGKAVAAKMTYNAGRPALHGGKLA